MKHPDDLTHVLVYHLLPAVLLVALTYGVIILVVRLATRRGGARKRGREMPGGLNRRQRRQERAVNRHRRRY